jgi:hypothetical protein
MSRNRVFAASLVVAMIAALGWSQETQKTVKEESVKAEPETAGKDTLSAEESEELQRLSGGKKPQRTWSEFIADLMTPKPFDKRQVIKIDDRYAYPHVVSGIKMEIVREDDEFIWLRGISPEDPNSPLYKAWAKREADEAVALDWKDIAKKPGALNFIDFAAVAVPPPDMESLRFEPSGAGNLPDGGRWQMGFAVADMNEDGHSDLVFPPRRKQYPPSPAIFLGDGKGIFDYWEDAKWPENFPWDYGGVAAADLNNDGHQDVVVAAHFKTQFALLSDGKGHFPSGGILPSPDPRLTSRAVTAADFDGDGRIDLGFVSEIDYDMTTNARIAGAATVWVLFNRGETWEISTEGLPTDLIADVIRSADIDGDGRSELVLSSNTLGPRFLVFTWSDADGWQPAEHRGVLSSAYHYNVEPDNGGVFATFVQFRRYQSETQARNGLVRYPVRFDGEFEAPEPLVWDTERGDVFFRMGVGDLNGDGRTDLVAGRKSGGLEVFVQTEDGEFYRERGSEFDGVGRAFDLRLVDLDGDGRDDIVAGCVTQGEKPGGVYVWLTRPSN